MKSSSIPIGSKEVPAMLGFPFASSSRRCRSREGPLSGVPAADVSSAGNSSFAVLTVVLEGPVKK